MRLKQYGQVAFGGDLAFLFGGNMKVLRIFVILLACLAFTVTTSMAGGKKKTKIRYKCYRNGERVPCPENFKESPEFKTVPETEESSPPRHQTPLHKGF